MHVCTPADVRFSASGVIHSRRSTLLVTVYATSSTCAGPCLQGCTMNGEKLKSVGKTDCLGMHFGQSSD